jgi:CheY-like chemotaxis protein
MPLVGDGRRGGDARRDGRPRILFADDRELNRKLVGGILSSANFAVDTVPDGKSAVGALASNAYDLVLMDIDMPGFDGHQASAFIRRMGERGATLPIVALSGKNRPIDRARSKAAGMDGHIAQPISPAALVAKITEILSANPVARPQAGAPPVWCAATFEDFTAVLGADRMDVYLALFSTRLTCMKTMLGEAGAPSAKGIAGHARDLASAATMLGFLEVARACDSFLQADPRAPGLDADVPAATPVGEAIARALDAIEQSRGRGVRGFPTRTSIT